MSVGVAVGSPNGFISYVNSEPPCLYLCSRTSLPVAFCNNPSPRKFVDMATQHACTECGEQFRSRNALFKHVRSEHRLNESHHASSSEGGDLTTQDADGAAMYADADAAHSYIYLVGGRQRGRTLMNCEVRPACTCTTTAISLRSSPSPPTPTSAALTWAGRVGESTAPAREPRLPRRSRPRKLCVRCRRWWGVAWRGVHLPWDVGREARRSGARP